MKLDCIAEFCYKPLDEKGEDALAFDFSRSGIHTLAVFDGCGGSGAWKYPEFKNATGAFVAAQSIAAAYLDWAGTVSPDDLSDPDRLISGFSDKTQEILQKLKRSCAPMGVSGSLVKSFPCTASAAFVSPQGRDSIILSALNVGDSRVYFLTPENGLVQLTRDDSRGNPDPLDSLRDNAPLSDLLNADKPYRVKFRQAGISLPCAVLCATDGVFGFVRSPMDFEYLLLKALEESDSAASFEKALENSVRLLTGDDSTLVMAFYGFGAYSRILSAFRPRYESLGKIIRSFDRAKTPEELDGLVRKCWESYKKATVFDEMRV